MLNKLYENMKKALHEEEFRFNGNGIHKVKIRVNGEEQIVNANLYIEDARCYGAYDNNIYGVEPQYAVGGYDFGDMEYDIDNCTLDDDEIPEDAELLEIIDTVGDINWDDGEALGPDEDDLYDQWRDMQDD